MIGGCFVSGRIALRTRYGAEKANEVDGFLSRPSSSFPVVLLYGPDKGLVSERARRYAEATKLPLDDPFAVIRMEADEIDADPSKLADEARTISMFGGERLIWIKNAAGQKKLADAIKLLATEPPHETFILIEAGDLKRAWGCVVLSRTLRRAWHFLLYGRCARH